MSTFLIGLLTYVNTLPGSRPLRRQNGHNDFPHSQQSPPTSIDPGPILDPTIPCSSPCFNETTPYSFSAEATRCAKGSWSLDSNYARINEILGVQRGGFGSTKLWNLEAQVSASCSPEHSTRTETTKCLGDAFRKAYMQAKKSFIVPDLNPHLTSRPGRPSSRGRRLLLANYAVLWKICHDEQTGRSILVIIDSRINTPKPT